MNRTRILAISAALVLASSMADAVNLDQKGQPPAVPNQVGNYGMGVATRVALKAILPAGWKTYVHQSVTLPPSMDWAASDTWLQALERMAAVGDLSVLVDWDNKSVLVRSPDVAVQEDATRSEIAQAATTPLPRFKDRVNPLSSDVIVGSASTISAQAADRTLNTPDQPPPRTNTSAPKVPASKQSMFAAMVDTLKHALDPILGRKSVAPLANTLPVVRTNPTTDMVAKQSSFAAGNSSVMLHSTGDFAYTDPVALNRPSARSVVQAIASRYKLKMIWASSQDVLLKGPVTLLADNAEQDTDLLRKALGPVGGLIVEYSASEGLVRAYRQGVPRPSSALAQDPAGRSVYVDNVPDSFGAGANTVRMLGGQALTLEVKNKEPLEYALNRFLRAQGYTLGWHVPGGFEASHDLKYDGGNIAQVLATVLPALGVSADIFTREKHVVVRPWEPSSTQ